MSKCSSRSFSDEDGSRGLVSCSGAHDPDVTSTTAKTQELFDLRDADGSLLFLFGSFYWFETEPISTDSFGLKLLLLLPDFWWDS